MSAPQIEDITFVKGDAFRAKVQFCTDQSAYTFTATADDESMAVDEESATVIYINLSTTQTQSLSQDAKWRLRRSDDLTIVYGKVNALTYY